MDIASVGVPNFSIGRKITEASALNNVNELPHNDAQFTKRRHFSSAKDFRQKSLRFL